MESVDKPTEVASKVLRRAQVSKMTRALQDRLALANVKIKHGWENLSLDSLEPRVDRELKRKRPSSSNDAVSSLGFSHTSDKVYPVGILDTSPLAPPIFSEDIRRPATVNGGQPKRSRTNLHSHIYPASSNKARGKVRRGDKMSSWKSNYRLPESSPTYGNRHHRPSGGGYSHSQSLSFVSHTSTVAESPTISEVDESDLPLHSFQATSAMLRSSPPPSAEAPMLLQPSTPPPFGRDSTSRLSNKAFKSQNQENHNEEGADLLLFLATSPSPANLSRTPRNREAAPSTPPPKMTPLPSSMMSTPGGTTAPFLNLGSSTPLTGFNFADFVNVTPSPAQGPWSRTPANNAKTPSTSKDTKNYANIDNLIPPSPSPGLSGFRRESVTGLGMELGGELVS